MRLLTLRTSETITEAEEKKHWGFHLMLDISGCNENTKDKGELEKFLKDLVPALDMKAVGEPIFKRFGEPDKYGYSVVQIIVTSAITIHIIDATHTAYLDVFSCKDFDPEMVVKMVKERFGADDIKQRFVYRDARDANVS